VSSTPILPEKEKWEGQTWSPVVEWQMTTYSSVGFLGVVVCGHAVPVEGSTNLTLNVTRVLGSGFVISVEKGLILTCEHVFPRVDRENRSLEYAFFTFDDDNQIQIRSIDRNYCEQWMDNDLIALRLFHRKGLTTLDLYDQAIIHGRRVLAMGIPLNPEMSTANESVVTSRAVTAFVVSIYPECCEMDRRVIRTMSGGPVMIGDKIAGVAFRNEKYSQELITEEATEVQSETGSIRTEKHFYKEVQEFGVFYKATSFAEWLMAVVDRAPPGHA